MEAELSPSLLRTGLELAGALEAPASGRPPAGSPAQASAPDRLGAHQVLRYAIAEEAETYRRIMRVLYLEHQAFGLRLRPAQVADRLRERYALTPEIDWLEERLAALDRWGALERDHDASLASTAAEWRRNRYTYDVTSAGRLTEELLAQLDALGEEIARLDTARLPSIRDALARLADQLAQDEPDGTQLRSLFERVLAEVEALHAGALAFMRSLGDLMRTVERVGEDEFERGKGALLERWRGLRAWFVGDEDHGSPWRTLNDQVVDAIRAVLAIAERLIERRSFRVDRAAVLLRLAAQVSAAPPGEATAWLRAAFGLRAPRHVGVPEPDPEQVADRGRTQWLAAPPAPVVAHLRTPGVRTPGTGRGARIADLSESRRRFERRRAAERLELDRLLVRMSARSPFKLSSLGSLDAQEFRHLLGWIGRAYESPPGPDGARRAGSSDGRATIALRPPSDPLRERTRLRAPHGTLDLPDFQIEVLGR